MGEIPCSVVACDNVQHFKHIVKDPITPHLIVLLMALQKVLDLGKRLFDRVEVWQVGWEIFDANADTISKLFELSTMMDFGIVEDQDTEWTWVWRAFW